MIRVVVTGSECTGKSTLAAALAQRLGAPCVSEFARRFVQGLGRAPEAGDVEAIARGQMAAQDAVSAPLAVLDTDLLSTVVYSRHYYGDCPAWIEVELRRRAGDLYLLAGIDVPWVADGDQRDRPHRREEMQGLFAAALGEFGLPVVTVSGPVAERLQAAVQAVARLQRRGEDAAT